MKSILFSFLVLLSGPVWAENVISHIQNVSVMVSTDRGSGSGTIITRDIKPETDSKTTEKISFVLTAAHVVESQRSVRTIVDPTKGTDKKIIEFKPVFIIKDLVEDGRKVGESKFEGKVLKYSDSENSEDLALLMLYKRDFIDDSAKVYLEGNKIIDVGTNLYHLGSRHGSIGSGSLTTGIVSKIGQVITLNNRPILFDLSNIDISPGSSGGGLFLVDGKDSGKYCGMVVRGGENSFCIFTPIRRIYNWAKTNNLDWILDERIVTPTLKEINKISIE
jgi:S1-C subfamily serine protease